MSRCKRFHSPVARIFSKRDETRSRATNFAKPKFALKLNDIPAASAAALVNGMGDRTAECKGVAVATLALSKALPDDTFQNIPLDTRVQLGIEYMLSV